MTALGRPLDFRYRSNRLVLILSVITAVGVAAQLVPWAFFSYITFDWSLGSFLMVFLTWALGREYDPDRPATANISAGIVAAALIASHFLYYTYSLSQPFEILFYAVWAHPIASMLIRVVGVLVGLLLIRAVVGSVSPALTVFDRIVIHALVLGSVCFLYFLGVSYYFPLREPDHGLGFFEYRGLLWFMFFGAGLIQLWICYALLIGRTSHVVVVVCVRAISAAVLIYGIVVLVAIWSGLSERMVEYSSQIGLVAMIHLAALVVFIPWLLTLRTETIRSKSDEGGAPLDPLRVRAGRAMLPMVAVFAGTLFLLVIPVVAAIMRYRQPDPEPEMPKVKAAA